MVGSQRGRTGRRRMICATMTSAGMTRNVRVDVDLTDGFMTPLFPFLVRAVALVLEAVSSWIGHILTLTWKPANLCHSAERWTARRDIGGILLGGTAMHNWEQGCRMMRHPELPRVHMRVHWS